MLERRHRLTARSGFEAVRERGRRAGTRTLVVQVAHPLTAGPAAVGSPSPGSPAAGSPGGDPRVGFAVGRGVGNAVVRNRVKRRLRHLTRERLDLLPRSAGVVVRALPAAAHATSAQLGADLDRALRRCLGEGGSRPAGGRERGSR